MSCLFYGRQSPCSLNRRAVMKGHCHDRISAILMHPVYSIFIIHLVVYTDDKIMNRTIALDMYTIKNITISEIVVMVLKIRIRAELQYIPVQIHPFAKLINNAVYKKMKYLALHTSRAPKIYKYCTLDSRQENLK